jgi:hypothetical protein
MNGEIHDHRPAKDAHVVVERAEKMVAEQAGISIGEASIRVSLYARFHDLQLGDACQGSLQGTIRVLTVNESKRLQPPAGPPP